LTYPLTLYIHRCMYRKTRSGIYKTLGRRDRGGGVRVAKKLTTRQLAFCESYLVSRDKRAAALAAGYSGKNIDSASSQILHNALVQDYLCGRITKLIKQAGKKTELAYADKIETLATIINRGNLQGAAPSVVIAAINEANRMQGHHAPAQSLNVNVAAELEDAQTLLKKIKEKERDF
jgi:phage terminase small subunit